MEQVKVRGVVPNNRKRAFEVQLTDGRQFEVPYVLAEVDGRVLEAFPDTEIGRLGFSFRTDRGDERTMLLEQVLYLSRDPETMHRHLLLDLTVEARRRASALRLGVRQLARMLDTSPARAAQLLDTADTGKSVKAMLGLLSVLGADVRLIVTDRDAA